MIAVGTVLGLFGVWLFLCDKHNGAAMPLMLIGLGLMALAKSLDFLVAI